MGIKLIQSISCISVLPVVLVSQSALALDDFHGLGDFDGHGFLSTAFDVSADGNVVVGGGDYYLYPNAYRWTAASGMTQLGSLTDGGYSQAYGVSADGSVITGYALTSDGEMAFRWTESDGMVSLGTVSGGAGSRGNSVNADGSVIVGFAWISGQTEAFRWTETDGMVGLGDLSGSIINSSAWDVNADGSVVVGFGTSANGQEAFRWEGGVMTGLGDLPGGGFQSQARGVSADGSVIVGVGDSTNGSEAFRWTATDGMVGLGDLPGGIFQSVANNVSADGNVIVGYGGSTKASEEAFRWTQVTGMQSVQDWLGMAGITVEGWTLREAWGVNSDGSVVVGFGESKNGTEAWIARVSFTGSGLVSASELSESIATVSAIGNSGYDVISMPFNGSHHRPLLAYHGMTRDNCFWVNGDLADYGYRKDSEAGLAEIGGCYDEIPQRLRLGIGAGKSYVEQKYEYNGESNLDGQYLLAELDYKFESWPGILSLTGLIGRHDAEVTRGYLNAGSQDFSYGNTTVDTIALRLRLDWLDAFRLLNMHFTPRAAYTAGATKIDGYTETGGGFPTQFDARKEESSEFRYGIDGEVELTKTTWLHAMVEAVHRFDDSGSNLTGSVLGLYDFNFPGGDNETNWERIGLEVEHLIGRDMNVSLSVNRSTEGIDPKVSGAISFRYSF